MGQASGETEKITKNVVRLNVAGSSNDWGVKLVDIGSVVYLAKYFPWLASLFDEKLVNQWSRTVELIGLAKENQETAYLSEWRSSPSILQLSYRYSAENSKPNDLCVQKLLSDAGSRSRLVTRKGRVAVRL